MLTQINRAVIKAGLIRRARTYSLIIKNNTLFIINTGPAGRKLVLYGLDKVFFQPLVDGIHNKYNKQIQATEELLSKVGPDSLLSQKHNLSIPLGQITDVKVSKSFEGFSEFPKLQIITTTTKLTFYCQANPQSEIEEFANGLRI